MALHTCGKQGLVVQRALEIVAVIDGSVIGHLNCHVAVGAVQKLAVLAQKIGLHLGMLGLQLFCSGSGLDPVIETHRAVRHDHVVVECKDCLRSHGVYAGIGHHRLLVGRSEIILYVTLSA